LFAEEQTNGLKLRDGLQWLHRGTGVLALVNIVTKRTGGTTKHQRQHHAQCCNGHQTHSMQHGAQPVV